MSEFEEELELNPTDQQEVSETEETSSTGEADLDRGEALKASLSEPADQEQASEAQDTPSTGEADDSDQEAAGEAEAQEPEDGRAWYVVHSYSGYENKVKKNLENRIESMGMQDKIFQVVVPTEEEVEIREGARRTLRRRVFPGYILVQMIMDDDSWAVVRNTPGVTGFVQSGDKPSALAQDEVKEILERMEVESPRIKVSFRAGQAVRVVEGPFAEFVGTVDELNMEKGKVRVLVSFFGREVPVEMDLLQVEKL